MVCMKAPPLPYRLLCRRSALFGALFFACSFSSAHAYEWTKRAAGGPYSWSDSGNWLDGSVPGTTLAADETIAFYNSSLTFTVNYDRSEDQVIQGLLYFYQATSGPGKLTLDMNGKKLIFDGGTLRYGPSTSASVRDGVVITNGTVQFGTGATTGDLVIGGDGIVYGIGTPNNYESFAFVFGANSILDSRNLRHIGVVDDTTNAAQNLALDLSGTTFVSGPSGENVGVLSVKESISVGNTTAPTITDGRNKTGLLKMGAASEINIGTDLIIGQYIRSSTGSTNNTISVTGTVEMLATHPETTLNIGRDLRVGVGDKATGNFTGTPEILNVHLGSAADDPSERGVLYVGYKHVSQGATNNDTSGSFVGGTEGGEVTAYVKEFRVGQNTRGAGSAEGLLDLRHSSTILIDIAGDAVIGNGFKGVGEVYLSRGSASSETLSVGNATDTTDRSILSLGETRWSVVEALEIGALGEISVTVTDAGGGIDLLSGDMGAFSITENGFLEATFDELAGSNPLWALRWAGKHDTLLAGYLEDGLLRGAGAFGGDATVFYDGEYTYFGLAQAIPEPSTLLLLGVAGGLGMFGVRSRRRS